MSFSALIFSLDTIILVLFVYRIRYLIRKEGLRKKYYKRAKISPRNALAKYFLYTVLILMISYLLFTLGLILFSSNKAVFRIFKIAGDLFLFSSYAYGIIIPLSLRFSKVNKDLVIKVLLGLSFFIVVYQFFYYPSPEVIDGLVFWNVDPLVAWVLYIYALTMWLPTGVIFFQEGLKNKDDFLRYSFLSASFIMISTTGPLMLVTKNEMLIIASHIFMTTGFIFLFLGMFYQRIPKSYKFIHDRTKKRN